MRLFIFGVISSLFISSCETEYSSSMTHTLLNKSEYPISIKKWKNGTKKIFSLAVSDSIIQEFSLPFGNLGNLITDADSLDIIFDNTKIRSLTVLEDTTSTNILRLENHKELRDGNSYYYTYTFSKIDYTHAIDCDSHCE